MAERMVDLWVPLAQADKVRARVLAWDPSAYEQIAGGEGTVFRLVVAGDKVEALLDELEPMQGSSQADERAVRAVVVAVAAMSPRLPTDEEEERVKAAAEEAKEKETRDRVSRDELFSSLKEGAQIRPTFFYMVILSTIVAAVGLSRDSAAVVIGAMVIAPLLGPNMALALATTLADGNLAARALLANALGVGVAIVTAVGAGLVFGLDLTAQEVASRTSVSLGEIVLALATGAAGAIAATRGAAQSLVGVMVAVSLLPPLVIACMLGVQGHTDSALRALLLVVGNIVCINLAAVSVFRLRGIRPRTWYDDQRSRKATLIAMGVWLLLLASIVALVLWAGAPAEDPGVLNEGSRYQRLPRSIHALAGEQA